jgi:putative transposase
MDYNIKKIFKTGGTYMITFRLSDSIPQSKLRELKKEYDTQVSEIVESDDIKKQELIEEISTKLFDSYEHQLDEKPYGSCILANEEVASILNRAILDHHGILYKVNCFVIMPNHVHILFSFSVSSNPLILDDVASAVGLIKGRSSRLINKYYGKKGKVWADGYWDRYMRNELHYGNSFYYVINNPTKAFLDRKFSLSPYMWRKDRIE